MSDSSTFDGPKVLLNNLARLKRLSRPQSRKVKGSANRTRRFGARLEIREK